MLNVLNTSEEVIVPPTSQYVFFCLFMYINLFFVFGIRKVI